MRVVAFMHGPQANIITNQGYRMSCMPWCVEEIISVAILDA